MNCHFLLRNVVKVVAWDEHTHEIVHLLERNSRHPPILLMSTMKPRIFDSEITKN